MTAPDRPLPSRLQRLRPSQSQLRLMAALAALVVVVVAISGALAEIALHERETARIGVALEARAALVRELVRGVAFVPAEASHLDALADRAAEASRTRVTLIARDGRVLGDSDVPVERLQLVENHADRPEVRAALAGAVGRDARPSATVGRRLLYVALPAGDADGGAVRVAAELTEVEAAIADLRERLLLAGAAGVLASLILAYGVSWLTLRPLRELRGLTHALAAGNLDYRIPRRFRDELGEISRAIRSLAEQLRERVAVATREREQLRAVLDGMAEGVLVVDEHNEVVLANHRVAAFYGARPPLQGRSVLAALRDAELD